MSEPAKSNRLTVAMIVRDAEDLLRDSLESIQSIADEIVITDTGSADKSIDVGKSFGATVVECEWKDDFSAARNACLSRVTSDWVLWLDAGDRLSADDAALVRQQIAEAPTRASAYLMFVEIPPNGTNAAERIAQVRLAPKHPLIRFSGRVRESLLDSLTTAQVGIEPLEVCIRRSSKEHDLDVKTAKAKRNIRLAEVEIRDTAMRPELLNCLGDAFQTLEDHDRSIQFFRHSLQACQVGSPDMLEAYYGIITSLDGKPGQGDEQIAICMQALEAFPMDAQLLCAMGGYLQAQGQTELAMKAYQTTCKHGQINPGVWHVSNIHEIATVCCSLTLQLLGRNEEAVQTLVDATAIDPQSLRIRRHLLELYIQSGQRGDALKQLDQFPAEFPNRNALRSAVRGACMAAANNWIAAKAYLKTGYNAGSRDPICLRWYATTLIASGEIEEATPIVDEWIQIEPSSAAAQQMHQMLHQDDEKPIGEGDQRQVRIDASESQQSHLTGAPISSPLPHASPASRIPHQR
ncbi:MAG: tetratricopeptide repeat protein [Planctomycetes bacterium]|nr:tetratricopeptide repeat protein [Planctomycetota bacterium]